MKLSRKITAALCAVMMLCSVLALSGITVQPASAAASKAALDYAVEFNATYAGSTNTQFYIGVVASGQTNFVRVYDNSRSNLVTWFNVKSDGSWSKSSSFKLSSGTHSLLVVPVDKSGIEGASKTVKITITAPSISSASVSPTSGITITKFVFSYYPNTVTKQLKLYYRVNNPGAGNNPGVWKYFAYQTVGQAIKYSSTGFTFPKGSIDVQIRPVDSAGVEFISGSKTVKFTVK